MQASQRVSNATGSSDWRAVAITLITVAAALLAARILVVPGPLGFNDYSRWATVHALLAKGEFAIGQRLPQANGGYRDIGNVRGVDMILHPDTGRFYSSKPPVLSTAVAGVAKVLEETTGLALATHPASVTRFVLFVFNWLPFVAFLGVVAFFAGRHGADGATRTYVLAAGAFGTFVATFGTTLTNHVPAAAATATALFATVRSVDHPDDRIWPILGGLAAGIVAALEPPALALVVGLAVVQGPRLSAKRALWFMSAAALPMAAFYVTNDLALDDPLFFYRRNAAVWYRYPGSYWENPVGIDQGERSGVTYLFNFLVGHHGAFSLTPVLFLGWVGLAKRWQEALLWLAGLIVASLVGRYLYKSLEWPLPVALIPPGVLALVAATVSLGPLREAPHSELLRRVSLAVSLVVLGFYLVKTSNYGGVTSGPRWFLWLTPLWLVAMSPAVERLWRYRWGTNHLRRGAARILLFSGLPRAGSLATPLAVSTLSALKRSRLLRAARWAVTVLVLVALVFYLYRQRAALHELRGLSVIAGVSVVLLRMLGHGLRAQAQKLALRTFAEDVTWAECVVAGAAGMLAGAAVPLGGISVKAAYFMKRRGLTLRQYASAFAFELSARLIASGILGVLVLTFLGADLRRHGVLFLLTVVTAIAGTVVSRRTRPPAHAGQIHFLAAVRVVVGAASHAVLFASLLTRPDGAWVGAAMGVLSNLLKAVKVLPGNLGLNEALFGAIGHLLDAGAYAGVSGAVISRVLGLVAAVLVGLIGTTLLPPAAQGPRRPTANDPTSTA